MLGRSPKAHRRLSAAFADGQVHKRYLAIVDGEAPGESGTITLPLVKQSTAEAGWRIITADAADPQAKAATTHWRRLAVVDGRSLIELRPETGRTHQLRVHAASGIGLPIVGDPVYGLGDPAGMMLHAASITIDRANKPAVVADAPIPPRFAALGFGEGDAG